MTTIATHTRADGSPLLVVAGELDLAYADRLATAGVACLTTPGPPVLVDCMDLTFIDAAGLGALIRIRNAASKQGVSMEIIELSPPVRRLLALTKLTGCFGPGSV